MTSSWMRQLAPRQASVWDFVKVVSFVRRLQTNPGTMSFHRGASFTSLRAASTTTDLLQTGEHRSVLWALRSATCPPSLTSARAGMTQHQRTMRQRAKAVLTKKKRKDDAMGIGH